MRPEHTQFERRHGQLAPWSVFRRRLLGYCAVALVLIALSLGAGMLGYEHYENLPWRDAFLNAAMLLGGMGPVNTPQTNAGKIFAGTYALYAGLIFIVSIGVGLAPIVHRAIHRFHIDDDAPGTD